MAPTRRRLTLALVVGLLAVTLTTGVAAGVPTTDSVSTAANTTVDGASADRTLLLTRDLSLTPNRPGEILVRVQYDTPSNLAQLRVELRGDLTIRRNSGFQLRDGEYVWDGQTADPTLTYRLAVNETADASGPYAGIGNQLFVDAGPWAVVRVPRISTTWSWRGETVDLSKSTTVDGEGVAGDAVAYLGPYERYRRTAHDQRFDLVVPERASLAASPEDILDTVADASDRLRVGDRDPSVLMVAAPTRNVQWAVDGLQTGESAFWVRDRSRLDTADNVWVHEYVHTRQDYDATLETRWFTEASASYYAALFALETDRIDFEAFRSRLALGDRPGDAETVLADPSTWRGDAQYTKGPLVAGAVDRLIRLADTGGSLQTVFTAMNGRAEPVTAAEFTALVQSAGNASVAAAADRYTTTTAAPSMWMRADHAAAFETALPNIQYAVDTETLRVDGQFRNGSVGADRPVELAVGERLLAEVVVSNTGTASGDYDTSVLVNGATVARLNGTLAANTTTRHTVAHRFSLPGTYSLAVGDDDVPVTVRQPATPTVADLVAPDSSRAGETVRLTATLRNDATVPARGNVTLDENGRPVETRTVLLAPGTERAVTFERTLPVAGNYSFRLGNRTVTVVVRTPPTATPAHTSATPSHSGSATTSGSGGGFGITLALSSLVLALVGWRRRRGDH